MHDDTSMFEFETKIADPGSSAAQIGHAFDEFLQAFEAFKDANDDRLDQIERRFSADVITTEKMARINAALDGQQKSLDELILKARRPRLGADAHEETPEARERKAAWDAYMRKGAAEDLMRIEQKSLSVQSNPDGGYLVPEETENAITRALSEVSPIRAISGLRQVSSNVYKKPFAITGAASGWVGETDARPETNSPTLAELQFPTMELYAMPAATGTLLDDSAVNIDQWIADEVQIAFAEQEGAAFVNGDGVNKPKGFLSYTTVANSSWTWGNIGYQATGVAGGFAASNPSDQLIDLVYTLKAGHRANAHWVMNRSTQAEIRKIKDLDGNYIWLPGASAGAAPTLMNYPIAEAEDMPDIATDAFALAIGDFRRGYLVVDRVGVRVLRDPFTSKPYVLFYTTKRVGGGVQNFEAIKLLKFGLS